MPETRGADAVSFLTEIGNLHGVEDGVELLLAFQSFSFVQVHEQQRSHAEQTANDNPNNTPSKGYILCGAHLSLGSRERHDGQACPKRLQRLRPWPEDLF